LRMINTACPEPGLRKFTRLGEGVGGELFRNAVKQPLSNDEPERLSNAFTLHPKIREPLHGSGCIIGVCRAKDNVTRIARLSYSVRCLSIADLTNQDDVWPLAHERPNRVSKT